MDMNDLFQTSMGAAFSPCKKWRYKLWRIWNPEKPYCLFLMLNPSTADETKNDPTVERCQRFAHAWRYGGLHVCNIFAFRATEPKDMKAFNDPVGPGNDEAIIEIAKNAGIVVCAWGNNGKHLNRSSQVVEMLKANGIDIHYLKLTGHNEPGHPLYLKKTLVPQKFRL